MKVGFREHEQELAHGALVDGFGYELSFAVEDECARNSFDVKLLVDYVAGVEQDGWVIAGGGDELVDLEGLLIGDGEDDQVLGLEVGVEGVELRHLGAAGSAPGGPEVDDDDFALEFGECVFLVVQVFEGEVSLLDVGVVVGEDLSGLGVERVSECGGQVFIADEVGEFHVGTWGLGALGGDWGFGEGLAEGVGDGLECVMAGVAFGGEAGEAVGESDFVDAGREGGNLLGELEGSRGAFVFRLGAEAVQAVVDCGFRCLGVKQRGGGEEGGEDECARQAGHAGFPVVGLSAESISGIIEPGRRGRAMYRRLARTEEFHQRCYIRGGQDNP